MGCDDLAMYTNEYTVRAVCDVKQNVPRFCVVVELLHYRVGVNSLVSRHTVGYRYFPQYVVMLCIGKYYHQVEEMRVESQSKNTPNQPTGCHQNPLSAASMW